MQYSKKLLAYFMDTRRASEMPDADCTGTAGGGSCGDTVELYFRMQGDVIAQAGFRTFGCGAAVACSSVLTELTEGMTREQALALTPEDLAGALDGIPEEKAHCPVLAIEALRNALA